MPEKDTTGEDELLSGVPIGTDALGISLTPAASAEHESPPQSAEAAEAPRPELPPAGWYPDPSGSPRKQWWDGEQWRHRFEELESYLPEMELRPASSAVSTGADGDVPQWQRNAAATKARLLAEQGPTTARTVQPASTRASGFTATCEQQAKKAWAVAVKFPGSFYKAKRERSTGQKIKGGCLGFLLFGIAYVFVPLLLMLTISMAIGAYALLMTLLALGGNAVLAIRRNKAAQAP